MLKRELAEKQLEEVRQEDWVELRLKKLSKLSPKEYQKQSQKLPKTLGTGGKPPPKDNKKPAGGGGFEEIG